MSDVTELLDAVTRGEAHAAEQLLPLLRRLAARYLDHDKTRNKIRWTMT